MRFRPIACSILGLLLLGQAVAFNAGFPNPENLPKTSELPDLRTFRDGSPVETPADWERRRGELRALALHYGYGDLPPAPPNVIVSDPEESSPLGEIATLRTFTIAPNDHPEYKIHCGIWTPDDAPKPCPVIIAIDPVWHEHNWPTAELILKAGFAFAGFVYFDVDDDKGTRTGGLHEAYPDFDGGTLVAWAWGASRLVDALAAAPAIDTNKIAITGHSRTGKAALLAGALDGRFSLVAPHGSGAGGAGSLRITTKGAESLDLITQPDRFHYWFHPRLRAFAGQEGRLPFDVHFLKALVAPRAFLSLEAADDAWANIPGTKATHVAAAAVYDWMGHSDRCEIWYRPGGHDMIAGDWEKLIDFAQNLWANTVPD